MISLHGEVLPFFVYLHGVKVVSLGNGESGIEGDQERLCIFVYVTKPLCIAAY